MGPPKDVSPSFRNVLKTSLTRPPDASLLIAGHRQRASMLHRLVELSRDPPFALHARRQIPLAFHGAFHGMKRRLQKVKPDEARQEIVETHRSHSRLVSVVVSTLSGTDIEASVS